MRGINDIIQPERTACFDSNNLDYIYFNKNILKEI